MIGKSLNSLLIKSAIELHGVQLVEECSHCRQRIPIKRAGFHEYARTMTQRVAARQGPLHMPGAGAGSRPASRTAPRGAHSTSVVRSEQVDATGKSDHLLSCSRPSKSTSPLPFVQRYGPKVRDVCDPRKEGRSNTPGFTHRTAVRRQVPTLSIAGQIPRRGELTVSARPTREHNASVHGRGMDF